MPRPLPTIPGVARCVVSGLTPSGRKWANIHHMRYALGASSPGTVELDNLDVELFRFYSGTAYAGGAAVLTMCMPTVTITQIDYTVLNATALAYSKTHTVAGTGTGGSLPSEVSAALTLRSNTRGRRYRGRIYLPPTILTTIDTVGNWTATARNNVIGQYGGMVTALAAKQWAPVVASYGYSWIDDPSDTIPPSGHSPKILSTWTPFATDIVSWTMDAKPDVQRRRK
jgi:hypothetical protein